MRQKRPITMPMALPIRSILKEEDLLACVVAAKLAVQDHSELPKACDQLNYAFHRLVVSLEAGSSPEVDPIGDAVRGMAAACRAALQPVASQLVTLSDDPTEMKELSAKLTDSLDPVTIALIGASRALHSQVDPGEHLLAALVMVQRLEQLASAAGEAFAAGARARQMTRASEMKKHSFLFGTEVLESYRQVTGEPVRISRASPAQANAGEPGGPLIRYTSKLYERLRRRCVAHPDLADLADKKALNPKEETIAGWCQDHKQGVR